MNQFAPDDRVIYSRYQELGALAGVLLDMQPEELLFFRVDEHGRPGRHGEPAVLVVKDTDMGFLRRADALYGRVPDPGPTRVFWYTPAEITAPSAREFVERVRTVGEALEPLPPADRPAERPECGGCQTCG